MAVLKTFAVPGRDRPFWADLHNHNGIGYGKGSLDRSYEIARGGLLDVFAFTPHGLWHDLPGNDPYMVEFHRSGFEKVLAAWEEVRARANAENTDGRFTTFVGFEWHSSAYGDSHVLYPAGEGRVHPATNLEDLQDFARRHGALVIPHHVGYRQGWRGALWPGLSPDVSPVVEVFSEHGNSLEAESHWAMLRHSTGGSERSQAALARLEAGAVFGLVASTDNHAGHPASHGEGLTGIWLPETEQSTRTGVFAALKRRHTYALSGDRIVLRVGLAGGMMGDVLPVDTPREVRYEVEGAGALDYVQILKNGRAVHMAFPGDGVAGDLDEPYVARLEFGWDAMTSSAVTEWQIRIAVSGGDLVDLLPCFVGGAGSAEAVNRVEEVSPSGAAVSAFTSRRNPHPTSSVVLKLAGDRATRVEVGAVARRSDQHGTSPGGCSLAASLGELLARDCWAAISDTFSAPKIRLGNVHTRHQCMLTGGWCDPQPGRRDFYLVKVQQKNGHCAWSSPIWCREP